MNELIKGYKRLFRSVLPLSNRQKLFIRPIRAVVLYHDTFEQHIRDCKSLKLLPIDTDNVSITVGDSWVGGILFVFVLFFLEAKIIEDFFVYLLFLEIWSVIDANPAEECVNRVLSCSSVCVKEYLFVFIQLGFRKTVASGFFYEASVLKRLKWTEFDWQIVCYSNLFDHGVYNWDIFHFESYDGNDFAYVTKKS